LSGTASKPLLGDKEIAVQICSNSHCRNALPYGTGQVGMLIVLCLVKGSWATGERRACFEKDTAGYLFFGASAPLEGCFYFILFCYFTVEERNNNMTKQIKITALLLVLATLFCLAACNTVDATGLWENATYRRDVTLGKGAKTVEVEIKAGDDAITVTVKTDADTLGEALLAHGLIEGKDGLYTTVNGMTADWNVDQSYWGFYKNGEYMMVGMDDATIADGEHYELVYTK